MWECQGLLHNDGGCVFIWDKIRLYLSHGAVISVCRIFIYCNLTFPSFVWRISVHKEFLLLLHKHSYAFKGRGRGRYGHRGGWERLFTCKHPTLVITFLMNIALFPSLRSKYHQLAFSGARGGSGAGCGAEMAWGWCTCRCIYQHIPGRVRSQKTSPPLHTHIHPVER